MFAAQSSSVFETSSHWAAIIALTGMLVVGYMIDRRGRQRDEGVKDLLLKELHPNGGNSLRDVVDGLTSGQDELRISSDIMFETSDKALYVTNENGVTIKHNKAYADMFWPDDPEQALTSNWLTLLTEDSKRRAGARLQSIVNDPHDFLYDMELLDGRILQVIGKTLYSRKEFVGYRGMVLVVYDPNEDSPS